MTLAEKIITRYCDCSSVKPDEYVTVEKFVGPIMYSFKGAATISKMAQMVQATGLDGYKKLDHMIYNEEHNNPPQEAEVTEMFKEERKSADRSL